MRRFLWPALVFLAAACAAAPLWSNHFLPFQDAPEHVAAIRVMADYHAPGLGFDHWFRIDLARLQYLAFYLPAALIAKAVGAQAACRVMLTAIVFALPASLWFLLGSFGRDRRLAIFAPAVFHSTTTYLGFFNFLESIPVALVAIALVELELKNPRRGRAWLLALCAAGLLWLHPSALAFVLGSGVVLALTSGEDRRRRIRALLPLAPALVLFGVWAVKALAARSVPGADHAPPQFEPIHFAVYDLIRFGNVVFGHFDEVFWCALVALWAALVLTRSQRGTREWRLALLSGLALAAFFVLPLHMGFMGYISTRAVPFFVLLALAAPRIARTRATSALLALAVVVQLAYAVRLSAQYRAFDREAEVADLDQVLQAAKPGERLVGMVWDTKSRLFQFKSYLHFAQYYELERGGRARVNFAETPWTPVRYRASLAPRPLPFGYENHPETFNPWSEDADYVLVRGDWPPPGPFHLDARAGEWALYERGGRDVGSHELAGPRVTERP